MEDEKGDFNHIIFNILITAIIITLVVISLVVFFMIKIDKNESCGQTRYTDYSGKELANSSFVLSNADSFVLQSIDIERLPIRHSFCASVFVTGSNGARIDVVDADNVSYGSTFIDNDTTSFCTNLDTDSMKEENIIGIKCSSCDVDNTLILRNEITGEEVVQTYYNGSVTQVSKGDTLDYTVVIGDSCKNLVQIFVFWYFIALLFLGIGILVLVGYRTLRNKLLEEFSLE